LTLSLCTTEYGRYIDIKNSWNTVICKNNTIFHEKKNKRAMMALRSLTCIKAPGAGPV
jgi:hypothetical protein